MVMLKLATDDPRKRYQAQQMQGIQAPRGVAPSNEPSVLQRASKIALDRGMDTAIDEGGKMAMKYGKPLFEKGMSTLMPSAAPTMSSVATPLMKAGVDSGIANTVAGQTIAGTGAAASGAGLMSSLGGMGAAAMASPLAPIVGGFALAKMLGFFSNGGLVGPLYSAEGDKVKKDNREDRHLYDTEEEYQKAVEANKIHGRGIHPIFQAGYFEQGGQAAEKDTGTKLLEELEKQLRKKKAAKEDKSTLLPSFRSLGGNISKVEYKSAGGETYKLSYSGGPLSKGE